jgi:hypothetical protein
VKWNSSWYHALKFKNNFARISQSSARILGWKWSISKITWNHGCFFSDVNRFSGVIDQYNESNKQHLVKYDDGDKK